MNSSNEPFDASQPPSAAHRFDKELAAIESKVRRLLPPDPLVKKRRQKSALNPQQLARVKS